MALSRILIREGTGGRRKGCTGVLRAQCASFPGGVMGGVPRLEACVGALRFHLGEHTGDEPQPLGLLKLPPPMAHPVDAASFSSAILGIMTGP